MMHIHIALMCSMFNQMHILNCVTGRVVRSMWCTICLKYLKYRRNRAQVKLSRSGRRAFVNLF